MSSHHGRVEQQEVLLFFRGAKVHYLNIKKIYPEDKYFRLSLRRFNCQDTAQNIVETTQKIMDKFETKTHVINTDLEKKENLEL